MNKRIEEMAKYLRLTCKTAQDNCNKKNCSNCKYKETNPSYCTECLQAEELYDVGYRKIPQDAVVLTKEGYDKLCHLAYFGYEDVKDQARKETAKEILQDLICYIEQNKELFCSRHKNINYTNANNLIDYIGQRAKQYGVEVEE